ncbi:all trans-polyprenyl-diphosphate synthase PDSS2 [Musca domestica]|uniref:All trans-polyprenyl-diphosphate synthase PDSS2 n=1 Tax=Musca domestica TaxID=7370 RepID=A0A9J7DJR2_MUSDO|nr:all trans-polyprenyl-diphosphate synthase PDSS2 [Musca domestica]
MLSVLKRKILILKHYHRISLSGHIQLTQLNTTKRSTHPFQWLEPLHGNCKWNQTIKEAKQAVGYSTTNLSLRWILNDDLSILKNKIDKSQHPLLKNIKFLLKTEESAVHIWGLIILLLSGAAGHKEICTDSSGGVLHSQRNLAEITQLILKSQIIHFNLLNLQKTTRAGQDVESYKDFLVGNKIALLFGDLLLGGSVLELSQLRNQEIVGLIMAGIRNIADGEFLGIRDEQNYPLPWRAQSSNGSYDVRTPIDADCSIEPLNIAEVRGNAELEWELRNVLNGGSLLGNACKSAMILAKHNTDVQNEAYLFGKHFHLAWQSSIDLMTFMPTNNVEDPPCFSLVSAPVLYHLENDPSLCDEIEKGKENVENVNYEKVRNIILRGPGLIKTEQLYRKHQEAVLNCLSKFKNNDARNALKNMILCLNKRCE